MSQLPTRLLMKFRKQFQAYCDVEDFAEFEYVVPVAGKATRIYIITKKVVLAELSTREHIFNKLEARKLRQLMAATGLTKDQVVNNPTYYKQIVNG
jgi:transcriptional regulator of NAD metabolism